MKTVRSPMPSESQIRAEGFFRGLVLGVVLMAFVALILVWLSGAR